MSQPIKINGLLFYEIPWSCGNCPAMVRSRSDNKGWCTLFALNKSAYASVPKRCMQLFESAFGMGGGMEFVIVAKEK